MTLAVIKQLLAFVKYHPIVAPVSLAEAQRRAKIATSLGAFRLCAFAREPW
jgi:hypothetical protein